MSLSEIDGARVRGHKTGVLESGGRSEAIKGNERWSSSQRPGSGRTGRNSGILSVLPDGTPVSPH